MIDFYNAIIAQTQSTNSPEFSYREFSFGLFCGVASAALFAIISWLAKAAFLYGRSEFSAYLAKQQLIDVGGAWLSEEVDKSSEGYKYDEILTLNQRGMSVEGTLKYQETPTERAQPGGRVADTKLFKVTGIYRERTLTAYYRATDQRSTSSGCITLKLANDDRLEGLCAYFDGENGKVVVDPCNLTRATRARAAAVAPVSVDEMEHEPDEVEPRPSVPR